MTKTDIILIEDDPLVGEIALDILTGGGYAVRWVQDPGEAVTAVKKARPKLVITDIMMPGVSGMDLCKTISSTPELAEVKLMVMSAKNFEIEKYRARMFGALHFLTKPFTEKGLLKAVKDVLSHPTVRPH
ncbi:MAG: response regulator [Elusimicrobiales bacterium]|nr:response regulator [Elusimicrobiales bacterium]